MSFVSSYIVLHVNAKARRFMYFLLGFSES
jgi:hypothetical protein